ncbi:MAG: CPBP family intramembrane glutamic endopeptidase [Bacteroidota bacterium]
MNDAVVSARTDKVLFIWVLFVGWFGVLMGLPWTIAVLRDNPETGWWWEGAIDFLFFIPASAAVGVWLGKKAGLGSGLRELVSGTPGYWKQVSLALVPGTLVGLALGTVGLISQNVMPKDVLIPELNNPNTFERLLRCLSAALTEEIAFRFGLMSIFVWIIRSVVKSPAVHTPSLWIGNLLSALVFAAAHFPQLELQQYGLSLLFTFVVSSTSTGMILGWLFMRYGLVSAIMAHLITDLVIYVIPGLAALIG